MRHEPNHAARLCRRAMLPLVVALLGGVARAAPVPATPTPPSDAEQASPAAKPAALAPAPPAPSPEQRVAIHMQMTVTAQGNLPFHAAFEGRNSLHSRGDAQETFDYTVYVGARPWHGAEIWINPEVDQGFGLAGTFGAGGFPSGEAYKVGKALPYMKLHRLFLRQTFDLGGEREVVDPDLNILGGHHSHDRVVITLGKFGVTDIFDSNSYAHDPRQDFLNWTVLDVGSFDYAADAWAYTAGGAAELYKDRFAVRAGLFNLSKIPNGQGIETGFRQYQGVGEVEERHRIHGRAGKIALTGWFSHANMGRYRDALALAAATGGVSETALVRRFATRAGANINVEQALTATLGLFARAGFADGRFETYEFTDVDRSVSFGASLGGKGWHRPDDRIGAAFVLNQASSGLKQYLAAGGFGPLIGDGALPHPGDETVIEGYYRVTTSKYVHVTFDAQLINTPAYNRDRGPVVVLGGRVHGQF